MPLNVRTTVLLLLVMVSIQLPGLASVIVAVNVVLSFVPRLLPGDR